MLERTETAVGRVPDMYTIGAALVTAVTLYLVGVLGQRLFDFPAPVTMLFLAVVLKLTQAVSPISSRAPIRCIGSSRPWSPIPCCSRSAWR